MKHHRPTYEVVSVSRRSAAPAPGFFSPPTLAVRAVPLRKTKRPQQMHPADIKAAIVKAGSNQVTISQELGVSPSLVHRVIEDKIHSRRVAAAIASVIGSTIDDLWPDQYPDKAA